MRREAVIDLVRGRAFIFPLEQAEDIRGQRILPMGVVEGKDKRRIVHDMKETGGSGSVNETTEWSKIPRCELSEVMKDIIKRILGLRAKLGTNRRILIQTMDAKSAYRQIGMDLAGAAAFGYVVAENVVVDMRLQFGWRGSPEWLG